MRDPRPRLDPRGDLGDRPVGDAEQDQLGAPIAQLDAALA
jgi:hypothetical protein